jgi:hypothetical protein
MSPKVIVLLVSKHLVLNDLVFAALKGKRDDVDVHFAISDDLDQLAELLYLFPFFALAFDRLHGCAVKINVNIIDLVVVTELNVFVS